MGREITRRLWQHEAEGMTVERPMAGIKRTGKSSRRTTTRSTTSRATTRRSTSTSQPQRSQFVKQTKPTTGTTASAPAKKSIQRDLSKPKPTTAQTRPAQAQPTQPKPQAEATTKPQETKPQEAKPQGGVFGGALGALGFGGQDKPAEAAAANKPAAAPPKEDKGLLGGLWGNAKEAVVNTALDSMGLGEFKDIGLGDRLTKLTPEQRGNLMDLADTLKQQDQGNAPKIDLKQHLGKLTADEKGKLFDLAASGKLKEMMADLPKLQQAAEASKPTAKELDALKQISQMLGRDKLGGADGRFNFGDVNAIANGMMRDRSGLRQQVLSRLNSEGKNFQARVADRALRGKRGLFTNRALQQINSQVPGEIKGQLSQGLRDAQTSPQTARTNDNTQRNLTFRDMEQFQQNMEALKGMQDRLGRVLGQQVVFPQGVSQEAINHTIQGAMDPQADARNIDRVLQSIIHQGRVELPLPPGGVLVPYQR